MKLSKLVELVENVNNFSDAWDTANAIYESRSHDFEFIRSTDGWLCKVIKVTKKQDGKDTVYVRSFVLQETAATMTESFKVAALKYLSK